MRAGTLRRVRTLVISDLHLGASKRTDLLRRPELREPLLEAVRGVDRLVILGDGARAARRPAPRRARARRRRCSTTSGRALGPDGELLLLAGNHDHGLVAGWIDGRLLTEPAGFLGLEQRIEPRDAGPLAAALAERAAPARVQLAYPGVWLRDDVYAIHGHYADLHTTVPTFERLAAGAMARWVVPLPADGATPDDYEAALAPLYAWMHALTQRSGNAVVSAGRRRVGARVGRDGRARPPRGARCAPRCSAPASRRRSRRVNAVGLGPVERRPRPAPACAAATCTASREVVRRLGVRAPHVIWGHSHRSGPWPGDDLAEWTTHAGGRVHNTGSWVYQPHFLTRAAERARPTGRAPRC